MKLHTPERAVLAACVEWLTLKRVCFIRIQPIRLMTKDGKTFLGKMWPSQRGVPDLLILHQGKAICCEVKSSTGKLSPDQESFKERALCAGAVYVTVRSVEDLMMVCP